MNKNQIIIKQIHFTKLHTTLKKYEKENGPIKIGKMSSADFLMANSISYSDTTESKEIRTKRIILNIKGDYSTDPNTLQGSIKLKANLGYGSDEYTLLQIRLNQLVKEYKVSANISPAETNKCEKVSDCVSLVNNKTSATPA